MVHLHWWRWTMAVFLWNTNCPQFAMNFPIPDSLSIWSSIPIVHSDYFACLRCARLHKNALLVCRSMAFCCTFSLSNCSYQFLFRRMLFFASVAWKFLKFEITILTVKKTKKENSNRSREKHVAIIISFIFGRINQLQLFSFFAFAAVK